MPQTDLLLSHDYALVDQLTVDGLPGDLPVLPLVPHKLEKDAHLLPLLVVLSELSQERRLELQAQQDMASANGQAPLFTTLLSSPAAPNSMRIHLKERLIVRLADNAKALLRYYDPRVFAQLQWILPTQSLGTLFGPITQWSVYLDGAWHSTPAPSEAHSVWLVDKPSSARLERIAMINQTLALLPLETRLGKRTQLGAQIDRLLVYAQERYGFEREEDRIAFALHSITVHPQFDLHANIRALITGLTEQQQTYSDATALFDQTAWQRIAQDMTTQGRHPS
jgi:Domain of unknown function (DUF4123)